MGHDEVMDDAMEELHGIRPNGTTRQDVIREDYGSSMRRGLTRPLESIPLDELIAEVLHRLPGWDDVNGDHRAKTPLRVANMLREMTTEEPFEFTTFPLEDESEMIVLSPIPFYTLCAHHVVPFFGTAHIGYVPDKVVAGLSKFPRAVKNCAKGFWVQEELGSFIANYLEDTLAPKGVAVVLRAEHLCMAMRGVKQPGVVTTTSVMRGVYAEHTRLARAEFLQLAGLT